MKTYILRVAEADDGTVFDSVEYGDDYMQKCEEYEKTMKDLAISTVNYNSLTFVTPLNEYGVHEYLFIRLPNREGIDLNLYKIRTWFNTLFGPIAAIAMKCMTEDTEGHWYMLHYNKSWSMYEFTVGVTGSRLDDIVDKTTKIKDTIQSVESHVIQSCNNPDQYERFTTKKVPDDEPLNVYIVPELLEVITG